jgi:S-adenosylmethionine:tRNA ribosyltransferase-isomerase
LLRAFADDRILERASNELDLHGYRNHEFGDSVMLEAGFGIFSEVGGGP